MTLRTLSTFSLCLAFAASLAAPARGNPAVATAVPGAGTKPPASILTPPAPDTPRVNGPGVFGVRPGAPFLYAIPATGRRPMSFAADGLPVGLAIDAATFVVATSFGKSINTGPGRPERAMAKALRTVA